MRALLSIIFVLFFFSSKVNAQTDSVITNVDAATFKSLIEKKDGVVIDLRTPDEIKKGKIEGAVEIDYLNKNFSDKIAKLDKKKTYYVYCAAGGRSADAAEEMKKLGFVKVFNLAKGYSDWLKKGMPVIIK